jgi:phosphoribosyl-AMP cyclohydrolase
MKGFFEILKFSEQGLIPAMIVDAKSKQVLTLCYMNREAVEKTLETGKIHVFRRSRGRLMMKGETSGHIELVTETRADCEGNSLLFLVEQKVAACHAGYFSCYYRRYNADKDAWEVVEKRVFDPEKVY